MNIGRDLHIEGTGGAGKGIEWGGDKGATGDEESCADKS